MDSNKEYNSPDYDQDPDLIINKPDPTRSRRKVETAAASIPDPEPATMVGDARQAPRKPKKAKKEKAPKRPSQFIAFFKDSRTHAFLGIVLICFAVYITVTSISFLRNGLADQSVVDSMTVEQMVESRAAVENVGGPAGAALANSLIVRSLGLGSLAIIVYLTLLGLTLMKVRKHSFWSLTFKTLLVAITVSLVLGLLFINASTAFPLGGYHGRYINILIIERFGWIGAAIVSLLLLAAIFYVYIADLMHIYNIYRARIQAMRDKAQTVADIAADNQKKVDSLDNTDHSSGLADHQQPEAAQQPAAVGFDDIEDNPDEIDDTAFVNPDDSLPEDGQDSTPEGRTVEISAPGFEVVTNKIEVADVVKSDVYDPTAELSRYQLPTLDLLIDRPGKNNSVDRIEQEENKERITKTLNDYGIPISHIEATVGPTVTLYEIIPAEGVRIAKIKRLEDDIAMSLAALGIRIIAPIPGKGTIGIEVPNRDPQTVSIRSILGSKAFQDCKFQLPMAMGATISNEVYIADLTKMPHLLVAGATGQGKSVGLNTIIASLLYKKHPAELKFVLIDPKMVEFSLYSVLEHHFLAKLENEEDAVVTDPNKAVATLNSLCVEMDKRYTLLRDANVRSITEYNERFAARQLNPEKGHRYLPYIVMIVDEFADLIMTAGKQVEIPIARIAQKARAVGMHMIIATQRPSTDVITGVIKANFPGRIAFRVSQMVDSKTILDRTGANQLIGRGDMLFNHNGNMDRVQCAFIDTPEVQAICDHIDNQVGYEHAYYLPEPILDEGGEAGGAGGPMTDRDPLFEEAAQFIITSATASTSSLQRRYSIGYNRAGKIMDQLENAGVVGPSVGGKPRQVLVDSVQLMRIIENN